jgi:hypothetical protein
MRNVLAWPPPQGAINVRSGRLVLPANLDPGSWNPTCSLQPAACWDQHGQWRGGHDLHVHTVCASARYPERTAVLKEQVGKIRNR